MDSSSTNIKLMLDRRSARYIIDMRAIAGLVTTVGRYVVEWMPAKTTTCAEGDSRNDSNRVGEPLPRYRPIIP